MTEIASRHHHRNLRLLAAALSLALMLAFLGTPSVQRTQEGRVLGTAREMLGKDLRGWLIPHLNGVIRLEKPPLAYWLAAAAFKVGGVSEGVGRVPFALAGWGTLLLTFAMARWLANERAGYFAAGVLLACLIFARHARLAETDILATFFITAGIVCIWRGAEIAPPLSAGNWLRLSGAMIGLVVMSKGLPALFVFLFVIALAGVKRDWRLIWRWMRSGAPLLLLLIAAPWFVYAIVTVGGDKFRHEVAVGVQGLQHTGSVFQYFPDLLRASAPWTALAILAFILAIEQWRHEPRARGMLAWFAAIIIPLLLAGQRQFHYLLPAVPALAVMAGCLLDQSIDRRTRHWETARWLILGTIVAAFFGAAALPFIARSMRGSIELYDWVLSAIGLVAAPALLILTLRSFRVGAVAFTLFSAVAATVVVQSWMPALRPDDARAVAAQIRAIDDGPYGFYGENISLPLVFYLGQTMQRLETPEELSEIAAKMPSLIVIAQTKSGRAPPPMPGGLHVVAEIASDDQIFEIYRVVPSQ